MKITTRTLKRPYYPCEGNGHGNGHDQEKALENTVKQE